MASNSDIPAYPFMFDPSQFANKYSDWAGKRLSFMGGYNGGTTGPTDAHGNPIASYGQAQQAHDAWAAANPAPAAPAQGTTLASNPLGGSPWSPGGYGLGMNGANPQIPLPGTPNGSGGASYFPQASPPWPGQMQQQQQAPKAAAAPTNPVDMGQAYLQALQNPGKVTTPGATVPQAAPPSNQSGVLQQFLANWGGNSKGAGNYDNSGFINSLKGMV